MVRRRPIGAIAVVSIAALTVSATVAQPAGATGGKKTRTPAPVGLAVPKHSQNFSQGVAVSGDTVAAAFYAHGHHSIAVYTRSKRGWSANTKPAVLSVTGDDLSDAQVAVSPTAIVVGSAFHGATGAAYVFVKPASGWRTSSAPTATLTANSISPNADFGASVAISGNTVIVGASNAIPESSANEGAAYVFIAPSGGWIDETQNADLSEPVGANGDNFGGSVSISHNTVVVGASGDDVDSVDDSGAAYVFAKPAGGWVDNGPVSELVPSHPELGGLFGSQVSIDGKTVVVGSPGDSEATDPPKQVGKAFVFTSAHGWKKGSSSQLTPTAALALPHVTPFDDYGRAVGVAGRRIVVSADTKAVGAKYQQGVVELFNEPAKGWSHPTHPVQVALPHGQREDEFGSNVALARTTLVAAAIGARDFTGRVYVLSTQGRS